jgi:hypothetical protein
MKNQPLDERPSNQPVLDGEERLATQAERDDIYEMIDHLYPSAATTSGPPGLQFVRNSAKDGGEQVDGK